MAIKRTFKGINYTIIPTAREYNNKRVYSINIDAIGTQMFTGSLSEAINAAVTIINNVL